MDDVKIAAIDFSNIVCRAFFAAQGRFEVTNRKGEAIEVPKMVVAMLRRFYASERPTHWVVCEDSRPSWRHVEYPTYKEGRAETPERLTAQWPLVEGLVDALEIPRMKVEGYEADDIIASMASYRWRPEGSSFVVVSSDKDLLQLVSDGRGVTAFDGMKKDTKEARSRGGTLYTEKEVAQKYDGLVGENVRAYLALVGDSVDNLPGVKGIGKTTAVQLLHQFGSFEALVAAVNGIGGATGKKLRAAKYSGQLEQMWRLVGLSDDAPLPLDLDQARVIRANRPKLAAFYKRHHLNKELQGLY